MAKNKTAGASPRIVNRQARHEYDLLETLEVGIMLTGSEVKSIRASQVSIAEGFARIDPDTHELVLLNVDIAPYTHASLANGHERLRPRRLLAHKHQIQKLHQLMAAKGVTLIPLAMYFVNGRVKVEIAAAKGRRRHDKREALKRKGSDKELRAAMTRKRL